MNLTSAGSRLATLRCLRSSSRSAMPIPFEQSVASTRATLAIVEALRTGQPQSLAAGEPDEVVEQEPELLMLNSWHLQNSSRYTEAFATLDRIEVLIDAGAEYQSYASDITRTFPVNGRFKAAQREIYELVLEAQEAAISKVKPGNHWNDPHRAAVRVLTKGLLRLGLLRGTLAKALKAESYTRFFMHRTGHWLGMDVHDVGDYKVDGHWRELERGMVLTIEPGLYIPRGSKGVAKKWWNIGIRIEDDVLVTKEGCEVLTDGAPKQPDDIEALMSSG